jgi:hypothetical protein
MTTRIWNRDVSEESEHVTHHEFASVEEAMSFLDSFCDRRKAGDSNGKTYWVERDTQYGAVYWGGGLNGIRGK